MRVPILALILSAAMLPQLVTAQGPTPYAQLQGRQISSLSSQQIDDLREGRGSGFALPAELNGYPGPMHVLEHADTLALSDAQRASTRAILEAMRTNARSLGEKLIDQEKALDWLFASGTANDAALDAATSAIGATQAALRAAHLRAHIAQRTLLSDEQIRRYALLRGYAGGKPHHH